MPASTDRRGLTFNQTTSHYRSRVNGYSRLPVQKSQTPEGMKFSALPQSAHAMVDIRPIRAEDVPTWFQYLTLPAVFTHTSWNVQEEAELLPHVWHVDSATLAGPLRFAVALRSTNELVGTAGFHTISLQNRSAEIAYDLAPQVWGKGIATYVCRLLTEWAHSDAGLIRVQAVVLDSNQRSERVLERCGFEYEGLLRSYRLVRGRPGDFAMYAHLSDASSAPA